MTDRSKRIRSFTCIKATILNSGTAYVHVTYDVTDLIHVLTNRISVAHTGSCEQFSVKEPSELWRWTSCGGAM
jgi:hypothetical protein